MPPKTPLKQTSLSALWGSPEASPAQTTSSHKKLRTASFESKASTESFYQDLEDQRLEAERLEKDSSWCSSSRSSASSSSS